MAEYYWRHALCSSSAPSTTARNQTPSSCRMSYRRILVDRCPGQGRPVVWSSRPSGPASPYNELPTRNNSLLFFHEGSCRQRIAPVELRARGFCCWPSAPGVALVLSTFGATPLHDTSGYATHRTHEAVRRERSIASRSGRPGETGSGSTRARSASASRTRSRRPAAATTRRSKRSSTGRRTSPP